MSIIKCHNCEQYYTIPDSFYSKITDDIHITGIYEAVIKCECGSGQIHGGEIDNEGVNMFSTDLYPEKEKFLDAFDAVMLEDTDDKNSEFSVIADCDLRDMRHQDIINLQRKQPKGKQHMNIEKTIIEKLLTLISKYDNDNICKESILHTKSLNDQVVIYRLTTKGEIGIGTPLYTGNVDTIITEEYYVNGDVVYANLLYREKSV